MMPMATATSPTWIMRVRFPIAPRRKLSMLAGGAKTAGVLRQTEVCSFSAPTIAELAKVSKISKDNINGGPNFLAR